MPRRRKPPVPDHRPSWRDPAMPVLAISKTQGPIYITPERWQRVCQVRLAMCNEPHYTADPTYNLRKDRP